MVETEQIIREGLKQGLLAATCNLYRVFTDQGRARNYEENFLNGLREHVRCFERMNELIDYEQ